MDASSRQRINELNRRFYAAVADEFDTTRGKPWPGWLRLLPVLKRRPRAALSVLDVGCGNGRFGAFLAENLSLPIAYHGLDNNPALLERARETLSTLPNLTLQLDSRDIVESPPDEGAYDLVVLFGVLHHIPGAEQRVALLRALSERLNPGGLLAFACWRFYEYERFRQRIVEWSPDLERETGDFLLDWRRGQNAVRYCHYVDDAELAALTAATNLTTIASYRADGSEGDANLYVFQEKMINP